MWLGAHNRSIQDQGFDFFIGPSGSDSNPGTAVSPWAITAINTKAGTYAGKRVGLQDGTYDVSTMAASSHTTKLTVAAGTVNNPTVIQAATARNAIISQNTATGGYVSAPIIGDGANGVGLTGTPKYITIKDLEITGGDASGVSFAGSTVNTCPGILVEGCHIHDIINPNNNSNIGGVVLSTGPIGAILRNCKIHDVFTNPASGTLRTQHGNSSAYHDWAVDTTVINCTLGDCNNIVYQKVQTQVPPPMGLTFQNNYVYRNNGVGLVFAGFDNSNNGAGGTPPFDTWTVNNNVIENCTSIYLDENTLTAQQCSANFFNNTIYCPTATGVVSGMAFILSATAVTNGAKCQHYNNIWDTNPDISAWGTLLGGSNAGDWGGTFDFNCYRSGSATTFAVWNNLQNRNTLTLTSLTTWRTVTSTPDTHSVTGTPSYVNGTPVLLGGTQQYKLLVSSVGKGTGQSGQDMGAWGGTSVPSSIGCNF